MPKLLFFDIDNTILDEKTQTIPVEVRQALKQAKQNGQLPVYQYRSDQSGFKPTDDKSRNGWICVRMWRVSGISREDPEDHSFAPCPV